MGVRGGKGVMGRAAARMGIVGGGRGRGGILSIRVYVWCLEN